MKTIKVVSLLVAVVLLFGMAYSVFASEPFSDVPAGAYYADAAERMAKRGILSGYGDVENRFGGEDTVTRAQIATLICKMLDKVSDAQALAGKTAFSDVPETHWSSGYVNYAVAHGIIVGDGDGNFRPDDLVKYEEVVKVIVCALYPNTTFEIDSSDWSKSFMDAANQAGLLKNLIGSKGTPMKRSDLAVITDAAMTILDAQTAEEQVTDAQTTAAEVVSETTAPSSLVEPSAETTAPVETKAPAETIASAETKATETTKVETTKVETTSIDILPPPPPGENESEEW